MQNPDTSGREYHERQNDFGNRSFINLPSIVGGGSSQHHGRVDNVPGPGVVRTPFLVSNPESISPAERYGLEQETYRGSPLGQGSSHLRGFGNSNIAAPNPKRAYRQRRKDPSCDACRERKVKCDATDTTSCTECSSRNVRCQFTKDTNRRMSSIKQVQDLERQLQEARAQLEAAKSSDNLVDISTYTGTVLENDIPDFGRSPRRMLKARLQYDLTVVRAQLSDVGRGILKPPMIPLAPDTSELRPSPHAALPRQEIAQQCLDAYLECVHRRAPVLHWPSFCQEVWALYARETRPITRESIALCFAVLAMGAWSSHDPMTNSLSRDLMTTAISYLDFWVENIGIRQGLTTFLVSMYMNEINTKSSGYVWLGSAIRIAQDKGLHVQGGSWSPREGEMRKRIWYSLYVWDRLIATELGRPMLIHDDDWDTEYPGDLDDDETIPDSFHPQKPTLLLSSIHVARLLGPLAELCRSLCIASDAIRRFEVHLSNCMSLFPAHLQLDGTDPLDPLTLTPLVQFQNARILLYRHNLSPACSMEQRSMAIDNCANTASKTADLMSRCFSYPGLAEHVETRLKVSATSFTCTHFWRCMLFLAYRQYWPAFHVLCRFSSLIGDSKPVNTSCGRHLSFFLHKLIDGHQSSDTDNIVEEEELLVLLSGDLQAGTNSWVWGSNETGVLSSKRQKDSSSSQPLEPPSPKPQTQSQQFIWDQVLSEQELQQWGGWDRVHEAAVWLQEAQKGNAKAASKVLPGSEASPEASRSLSHLDSNQSSYTNRSRITIASITDS